MPFTDEQAKNLHYLTQQEISNIRKKLKGDKAKTSTIVKWDLESQLKVLTKLMRKAMK